MHERHRLDALLAILEERAHLGILYHVSLQVEEAGDDLQVILDAMIHFCEQDLFLLQGGLEAGLAVAQLLLDLLALAMSARSSSVRASSSAVRSATLRSKVSLACLRAASASRERAAYWLFRCFPARRSRAERVALEHVIAQPRLHPFHSDLFAA